MGAKLSPMEVVTEVAIPPAPYNKVIIERDYTDQESIRFIEACPVKIWDRVHVSLMWVCVCVDTDMT